MARQSETASLRIAAVPLTGASSDYDALLDRIGETPIVLIGEATHGTHEFYRRRAEITRRLIVEKGFHGVAIEGDWPDSQRVHAYVMGFGDDETAVDALRGFSRFPSWMWRNVEVAAFVGWLRALNETRPSASRVGFYGLDLYSLYASIEAVLAFLDKCDPEAARRARERYSCFEHFASDTERYGQATGLRLAPSCEEEATAQLVAMEARTLAARATDDHHAADELFTAEQNARVVKNAEQYYRQMFRGRVSTWNLRDKHMADTLDMICEQLGQRVGLPKLVVWAHNSHVGDARATEMSEGGEVTLGQLVRERHDGDVFVVGLSTYEGTVTAAPAWDMPGERRNVRPALPRSWEALLHGVGSPELLVFTADEHVEKLLRRARLTRAIGVVYRPETERQSHYLFSRIGEQFDAVLHVDHSRAVEPLERSPKWDRGEPPETFPSAL